MIPKPMKSCVNSKNNTISIHNESLEEENAMLREKIDSIENELRFKNDKICIYNQKLKQYSDNATNLKSIAYNSENSDLNSNRQGKCMNYHENKYKPRPGTGELISGANEKRPLQKTASRSSSVSDQRSQFSACNQSMTINIDKLNEQIQELKLVREINNKELIKLETELQKEKARADKAITERNTLIGAMEDLTEKANEIEQTCQKLSRENENLEFQNKQLQQKNESYQSSADKIIGLNCIIDQIREQLQEKESSLLDLLSKLEASTQERTSLKKKIKSLESEISRIREECFQKIESTKATYERRISELEESVKILTKCIEKYETQIGHHNDLKEKFKLVQYQLSKVTKERDELKTTLQKEAIQVQQRELVNQK